MGTVESTLQDDQQHKHPTIPPPSPSKAAPTPDKKNLRLKSPLSPQFSPDHIETLKGVVCGSSSVGKSRLLHILRGDDPTSRLTKKRNLMALIPWKVQDQIIPVQFHIVENHIDDDSSRHFDFMIVIVDRKRPDSMEGVLDHIMRYFDKDSTVKNICFLLNFYDAVTAQPKKDPMEHMLTLEDVETKTLEKISSCQDKINLKFAHACLQNGFGLEALHRFFDIVYLNWRETILRSQLDIVQTSLCKCNAEFNHETVESFDELEEKYRLSVKKETLLERTSGADEHSKASFKPSRSDANDHGQDDHNLTIKDASKTIRHEEMKETTIEKQPIPSRRSIMPEKMTQVERQQQHGHHAESRKKSKQNIEKSKRNKKDDKRSVSSKKKHPKEIQQHIDPNQALEAFLASDDGMDDDLALKTTNTYPYENGNNIRNVEVLYSDSDHSTDDEEVLHHCNQEDENVEIEEHIDQSSSSESMKESIQNEVDHQEDESTTSNSSQNVTEPQTNENDTRPLTDDAVIDNESGDLSESIQYENECDLPLKKAFSSDVAENVIESKEDKTDDGADSDDDDGYTLDQKGTPISAPSRISKPRLIAKLQSTKVDTKENDHKTFISSEALAAIDAAQKEAEQHHTAPTKAKIRKKKKEKSEKKSKEKKSKRDKKSSS